MNETYSIKKENMTNNKGIVYYTYLKDSWYKQQEVFLENRLKFISPAEKALMSMDDSETNMFLTYSRTNMGIIFMLNENKIALIKNGFTNKEITTLLQAHSEGKDAKIDYNIATKILDNAQKNNGLLITTAESKIIKTTELGKDSIANFMFTDNNIGVTAEEYGNYIHNKYNVSEITLDFTDSQTINYVINDLKTGVYIDMIRIRGKDGKFATYGRGKPLTGNGGAIGVRFEYDKK